MKKNLTIFLIMMLVVMTSLVSATSDLNVNGINVPTTMYRDTTYLVDVNVDNFGPDDYSGADNLVFDNGDYIITNHALNTILNGGSETLASIPIGYANLGTYVLEANIPTVTSAPLNDVDMNNNVMTQTIQIINQIPTITNPGIINHIVGTELLFDVSAITTELDSADTLSYSFLSAPSGMVIDSVTGEISGWIPLVAGSQSFTVEVSDSYDSVSETLSVNSIADQPIVSFQTSEITFGDSNTARGNPVTMTATFENAGTQVLDNFVVELLDKYGNTILGSPYNPITSISAASLNPGDSAVISVTITLPDNVDSRERTLGSLKIYADGLTSTVTDEIDTFTEAESFLDIDDCDIYVDGDHDSCSGTVDVQEGDEIEIKLNVENLYSNDDIENVYFEIFDNNGWDIDEESSEKDIDGGDDHEFIVTFTLDDELDDDDTQITIEVFGDDDNNNFEHFATLTFDLEIDRDDNDIRVNEMEFLTNPIYNNAAFVDLEVEIRNAGNDDQDEAAIKISCPELGLDMIKSNIEIDNEDKESRRFQIELPNDVEAGTYAINVYAYYDDDRMTDSQIVSLEVLNYNNPYEESENNSESNTNSNINVNTDANNNENSGYINTPIANPTYGTSSKVVNDSWYLVILVILVLAVLGGIAFLASEYVFDNKKAKPLKEETKAKGPKKVVKSSKNTRAKKTTKKGPKKVTKKASSKKSYK